MIKISKFVGSKGLIRLEKILDKRKSSQNKHLPIVSKILKDIKKNKNKAVLKYEMRFSKNNKIKPSLKEIKQATKFLSPNIKKAIDFAYNRILKYHSLQKIKDISYKDKLNNYLQYKSMPINTVGIYVPANLPSTLLMKMQILNLCSY